MQNPPENQEKTSQIYRRIRERLDELHPKMSDREASLIASGRRNPDLLRKMKREGYGIPEGPNLQGLAQLLDWPVGKVLGDAGQIAESPSARIVDVPAPNPGGAVVPVMGTALGAIMPTNGDRPFEGFTIDMQPVQYARMPEGLNGQRDIYAIFVEGDSMDPMHPPGRIRFVQPHRPPAPGDTVVVQTRHWEHDPGQAYIKIYRRRAGGKVILQQINPPATLEVPVEYIIAIHRVATENDLFLI